MIESNHSKPLGIVGLTHMGIISSICSANIHSPVIGFDKDTKKIDQLNKGNIPISEPGLDDLLKNNRSKITFTSDFTQLTTCKYLFITLDIKTEENHISDYEDFFSYVDNIIPHIHSDTVIVLISQISVGVCRKLIKYIKDRRNDLAFELIYMVETLVFGNAVNRFLHPERIIIGTQNGSDVILKKHLYLKEFFESFNAPIILMNYESAELTKLAINFYLFNSVLYANALADLCEAYSADMLEIIPALKLDKRIGRYAYIQPSIGIAGGNITRDMMTLYQLGKTKGLKSDFLELSITLNENRYDWLLRKLNEKLFTKVTKPRIAIWGISYKKDTNSTKNSISLKIIEKLNGRASFCCSDPIVNTLYEIENAKLYKDRYEATHGAHCLIIFNDPENYKDLDLDLVISKMEYPLIIDCVSIYPFLKDENKIEYIAIGR